MEERKRIICARCSKDAPSNRTKYMLGIPLGPECYRIVKSREDLRQLGEGKRLKKDTELKVFFIQTEVSKKICPTSNHCLTCEYLKLPTCPLEEFYQNANGHF